MNLSDLLDLHFANEAFKKASGRGPDCIPFWALADAPRDGLGREHYLHAEGCNACKHSLVLSMKSQCPSEKVLSACALNENPKYARGENPIFAAIRKHSEAQACPSCRERLEALALASAQLATPVSGVQPFVTLKARMKGVTQKLLGPTRRISPVLALSCAGIAILLIAGTFYTPIHRIIAGLWNVPNGANPATTPFLKDDALVASYSPSGKLVLTGRAVPAEWCDRVLRMIQSKTLAQPPALARAVDATQSVVQVAGGEAQPVPGREPILVSPVETAVATVRPTFRWVGVPGTVTSTLVIADESGKIVLSQSVGNGTEFTIPPNASGLMPGHTYSWQVVVTTHGEKRYSSRGSFVIPDAETLSAATGLQKDFANSAILLAAVDETFALYADAEEQLQALKARNPGSSLPQEMLEDLAARRQRKE